MSDETTTRFLNAIAERVNAARVEEVHLFQPIRQGGMESRVAVVAVGENAESDPEVTPPHGDPLGDHIVEEPDAESRELEAESREPETESRELEAERREPETESREPETESPEPRAGIRLAVYTARYRLTLKGPERGKWNFGMQAEADAPLVTVDAVVRGVQRRSGDAEDPEKLSGDEFRALLDGATT